MNKKSIIGLLLFSCILIAAMFLGTMIMMRQGSELDNNSSQLEANGEDSAPQSQIEDELLLADNTNQNVDIVDQDNISDSERTNTDNEDNTEQAAEQAAEQASEQADQSVSEQAAEQPAGQPTGQETEQVAEQSSGQETEQAEQPAGQPTGQGIEQAGDIETVIQGDSSESETNQDSSDNGIEDTVTDSFNTDLSEDTQENGQVETPTEDALGDNIVKLPDMQLITNCNDVDYMQYIPEMKYDSKIEVALDIDNPNLDIDARSAILIDVKTRKVIYYKDPVVPVFPASTAKLLTALVALDICMEEEEVTVGDELDLVAGDSTVAGLRKGRVLSIRNLIEGMLVPSGNDAAYVIAAYVGKKSLNNEKANLDEALPEFIRLMNNKAKSLGTINSSFKTPDGYDAIGQYTTAYDMGMIGLAAAESDTIREVGSKTSARNVFVDGHDVTWYTTNSLIKKNSGKYYSNCIGLKTGTSEMAGRCLISLGEKNGKEVVSIIMDSNSAGRWEDSIKLLKYGLGL